MCIVNHHYVIVPFLLSWSTVFLNIEIAIVVLIEKLCRLPYFCRGCSYVILELTIFESPFMFEHVVRC